MLLDFINFWMIFNIYIYSIKYFIQQGKEISVNVEHPFPKTEMPEAEREISNILAVQTPPPSPTDLKLEGNMLTWNAEADLESGLAYFIVQRNGVKIGTIPKDPKNREE